MRVFVCLTDRCHDANSRILSARLTARWSDDGRRKLSSSSRPSILVRELLATWFEMKFACESKQVHDCFSSFSSFSDHFPVVVKALATCAYNSLSARCRSALAGKKTKPPALHNASYPKLAQVETCVCRHVLATSFSEGFNTNIGTSAV